MFSLVFLVFTLKSFDFLKFFGFYSKIIGTKLPGDSGIILELKSKFNNPVYPGDKLSINYEVISKHHSVSCITIKFRSINQTGLTVGTALVSVKIRA